jgi:hypothetical protein
VESFLPRSIAQHSHPPEISDIVRLPSDANPEVILTLVVAEFLQVPRLIEIGAKQFAEEDDTVDMSVSMCG